MVYFYMFGNPNMYPHFPKNDEAFALGTTLQRMIDTGYVQRVGLDANGLLKVSLGGKIDH